MNRRDPHPDAHSAEPPAPAVNDSTDLSEDLCPDGFINLLTIDLPPSFRQAV